MRQQGESSTTTITLPYLPIPGSILLAGFSSQQRAGGVPAISGGGARWTNIGWTGIASGAQIDVGLWIGIVGPVPSVSVTIPYTNSGACWCGEWQGLRGIVLASAQGTVGAGTLTLAELVYLRGGIYVNTLGARSTASGVTPPAESNAFMDRTNASRTVAAYSLRHNANRLTPSWSGLGGNSAGVSALIG